MSISPIENLPNEILLPIFQLLENYKDFCALSLTCKKIQSVVEDPKSCFCTDLSPRFLEKDPILREMPLWRKNEIARQIEANIFSLHPKPVLEVESIKISYYVPRKIVGGFFVLQMPGSIECTHLLSGKKYSIQILEDFSLYLPFTIEDRPLLATFSSSNFYIWDLQNVRPIAKCQIPFATSDIIEGCCYPAAQLSPVVHLDSHFLFMAHAEGVARFEIKNLLKHSTPKLFPIQNVIQIESSESHFIFVTSREIYIYSREEIREPVQETVKRDIRLARIHQDKIVLIYVSPEDNRIGEIRELQSGKELKKISYPKEDIISWIPNSIDFQGRFMYGTYGIIYKWDLDLTDELPCARNPSGWLQCKKVTALGRLCLVQTGTGILSIFENKKVIKHLADEFRLDAATTFEFLGHYLIATKDHERDSDSEYSNGVRFYPLKQTLRIYDLTKIFVKA